MTGAQQFFQRLENRNFDTFAELRQAANRIAVENLLDFPPYFDMTEFLEWAIDKGWIFSGEQGIQVVVPVGSVGD